MAWTNHIHVHNRKMPANWLLFVLLLIGVELDTAWLNHSPYLCSRKPCSQIAKTPSKQPANERTKPTTHPPTKPTNSFRFLSFPAETTRNISSRVLMKPRGSWSRVQPKLLHTKTAQYVWRPTNKTNKKWGQNFFESNFLFRPLKFTSSLMTATNCHTDNKMSSKRCVIITPDVIF